MFHRGVYRFYRKHYTRGVLDPRALLAAVALGGRAALLIAANHFKPAAVRADSSIRGGSDDPSPATGGENKTTPVSAVNGDASARPEYAQISHTLRK